jgi:preprotein translocase subunit SecD
VTCRQPARFCPNVGPPTRPLYYLFRYDPQNKPNPTPEMTGADLKVKGTRADFDSTTKEPIVLIQFTSSGAKKFQKLTRKLAERGRSRYKQIGGEPQGYFQQFVIVLDREIRSAPTIDFQANPQGIAGTSGAEIAGLGSVKATKDLALVLQTGALPVEFRVVSRETRHRPD